MNRRALAVIIAAAVISALVWAGLITTVVLTAHLAGTD